MKIDVSGLKEKILRLSEISDNSGEKKGTTRLAFSSEDLEGRKLVVNMMKEVGLKVDIDPAGNIIGNLSSIYDNKSSIIIGSHIDTVPQGGNFDGVLGVIAGVQIVEYLQKEGINLNQPVKVVAFSDEEGTFTKGLFGSRAFWGGAQKEEILNPIRKERNIDNKRLEKLGIKLEKIENISHDPKNIKSYLELHIEQGPILDRENIPIGIAEGIVGIKRYKISIRGEQNHAGTTPMEVRDDALVESAKIIEDIPSLLRKVGCEKYMVGTVGEINVKPGEPNIVPGKAEFTLEVRTLKDNCTRDFMSLLKRKYGKAIFSINKTTDHPSVTLNDRIINYIVKSCGNLGIKSRKMASGAGHDAMVFAQHVPSGLIFVPSEEGKSHCPEERTAWKHCAKGAEVLLETLMNLN